MEEQYVPKPDSHLGLAIFSTLCCCLPFGIVAIIKASKVGDLYVMKQYDAANFASQEAKKWSMIAIGVGLAVQILYLILYGAALAASFM